MTTANGARVMGRSAGAARKLNAVEAVRLHPRLAFGAPLVLVFLAVAFVLLVRPVYEATTSIRIDEDKSGLAMLDMLSGLAGESEVFTEMAVLRSRSLAEEVVRSVGLQVRMASPVRTRRSDLIIELSVDTAAPEATYTLERIAEGRFRLTGEVVRRADQPAPFARPDVEAREYGEVRVGAPAEIEGARFMLSSGAGAHGRIVLEVKRFQDTVEDLQATLAVSRPDREAAVVVARYRGDDPGVVQQVPDALATHFLERRQGVQSADARNTVAFLEDQIDTLEIQLGIAEETLRTFREENQIVSIEAEARAQVERLAQMQARRDLLEADRAAIGQLLAEAETEVPGQDGASPFRKLMAFPTLLQSSAAAEMLGQLTALENERAELLMTRTVTDRDVRLVSERIDALESQLRRMAETFWRGLGEQVRTLNLGLAGFAEELARIPAEQMTYVRMAREAEVLSDLYTLLQTKQKEAEIAAAIEDISARVVDPALYPSEPIRPQPWLTLLVAVLVGAAVGVGGAVAVEHMDRTVRDRGELQAATGIAVLGLIPMIEGTDGAPARRFPWLANGWRASGRPRLVEGMGAGHPATEAYRSLRTNINFSRPSSPPKALVFTSPMPGDGKSTTAANMALVLAQQGGRVLLVDGDMRRGSLHEAFGERAEPGLSNVLVAAVPLADALRAVRLRGGHTLDFLPSGVHPPNPAELLASDAMSAMLREVADRYDVVVFDAPPLNLVTDAALLGTRADGVVLVARAGVTEEEALAYALEQIERVRAPLLGTVLNGVDERRQAYYGGQGSGVHGYFDRE